MRLDEFAWFCANTIVAIGQNMVTNIIASGVATTLNDFGLVFSSLMLQNETKETGGDFQNIPRRTQYLILRGYKSALFCAFSWRARIPIFFGARYLDPPIKWRPGDFLTYTVQRRLSESVLKSTFWEPRKNLWGSQVSRALNCVRLYFDRKFVLQSGRMRSVIGID